jgi:hypothetical protein
MKISRRELAVVAALPLLLKAQPASPDPRAAKDIEDAFRQNSETLSKFDVPIATEPAFHFRP